MTLGILVLVWVVCAIFLGPLIRGLGLDRSHEEESKVTPEQWQLRIHHLLGYAGLLGGTAGILYLLGYLAGDATSMAFVILFAIGYPVLMVILGLISKLFPTVKAKNGYYLVLCAIFSVGILTFTADRKVEAASDARHTTTVAEIAEVDKQAMREWIEDLHAAGAHGAAGEIPPMLKVDDTGDGAQVTNLASRSTCLRVFRHIEGGEARQSSRCALLSRNREGDCTRLQPGGSDWFEMPSLAGRQACIGKPLSFRVGTRSEADVVWWSDPEIALLQAEIRNPTGHYGSTGSSTPEEVLASYHSMLRQGDRAGLWRAHIEAAEPVEPREPASGEERPPVSAAASAELSAAHERVYDLERLKNSTKPGERGLPEYLKVSSDWKGEVVLANASDESRRVNLLRLGRDGQGNPFLCAMHGSDDDAHGTLLPRRESATFRLAPDSPCPLNKRLPLHAEVRTKSGSLLFMSGELLDLRLAQAREELEVLKASAN